MSNLRLFARGWRAELEEEDIEGGARWLRFDASLGCADGGARWFSLSDALVGVERVEDVGRSEFVVGCWADEGDIS